MLMPRLRSHVHSPSAKLINRSLLMLWRTKRSAMRISVSTRRFIQLAVSLAVETAL